MVLLFQTTTINSLRPSINVNTIFSSNGGFSPPSAYRKNNSLTKVQKVSKDLLAHKKIKSKFDNNFRAERYTHKTYYILNSIQM